MDPTFPWLVFIRSIFRINRMKQYYIVLFTAAPPPPPKILQKPPTKLDIKGKKFGIQMVSKDVLRRNKFSVLRLSFDTKYAFLMKCTVVLRLVFKAFLPPAEEVWGKVMFLHLCVILFTGGGVSPTAPRCRPPWMQTSPPPGFGRPPGCRPPGSGRPPQMQTPLGLGRHPPPPPIRSTSGRYASYWHAYLLY